MSSVQRQKDKLLLLSAQEFLESGELASKALNAVSPHVIALWQQQQSQVLGARQTRCRRQSCHAELKRLERKRKISFFPLIGGSYGLRG